jgi:hypothetical protein
MKCLYISLMLLLHDFLLNPSRGGARRDVESSDPIEVKGWQRMNCCEVQEFQLFLANHMNGVSSEPCSCQSPTPSFQRARSHWCSLGNRPLPCRYPLCWSERKDRIG